MSGDHKALFIAGGPFTGSWTCTWLFRLESGAQSSGVRSPAYFSLRATVPVR